MARAAPTPDPDDAIRVGDIAIVPYPEARARLGCAAQAGLLIEDRRSVVQLWFPGEDRSHWIPREQVEGVALGRLPVHPRVEVLHRVARALAAEWIEIGDEEAEEPDVFQVHFPGASLEALVQVRDALADEIVSFRVEPGSMRRVRLRLRLRAP
jgi:hypothetical protein